jgi:hypothetical protein
MLLYRHFVLFFCLVIRPLITLADPVDYLEECWTRQVQALEGKYLSISYQEVNNRLYHSFEPWQTYTTKSSGVAYISGNMFYKLDSIVTSKATLVAKIQWTPTELLYLDHGDTTLTSVTKSDHFDILLETPRLSPMPLIEYFHTHRDKVKTDTVGEFAIYTSTINKTIVKLFINKKDHITRTITLLSHHDLYGDALSTFTFGKFSTLRNLFVPKGIIIEKVNGKVKDEVTIIERKVVTDVVPILNRPVNFTWKADQEEKPKVAVTKYNDHIHFIDLKHTDSKVMVVEFKDFLLVAEAPLTSENGELIIQQAKKIAPTKPIKYFTFGHHHPHYLGGIRPFIHKGATILTIPAVADYINIVASGKRTLKPDSLSVDPRPLLLSQFTDSTTITDGTYEMKIYHLGERSEHALDFLLYYFPKERMLFQGELVWIDKDKPLKKASKRQAGLYNFLKELKLDVAQIVQSWPLAKYNVLSTIPFVELERSMTAQ